MSFFVLLSLCTSEEKEEMYDKVLALLLLFVVRCIASSEDEIPPNCSEPFSCPSSNGKNITDPITNEAACFYACVTCLGGNWMCASLPSKSVTNRTGTFEEEEATNNATNDTTMEELFECQCGLMAGGVCSEWKRVCVDEGFDDIEGGFSEMDEGFAEMDERFSGSVGRCRLLFFIVSVIASHDVAYSLLL